MFLSDDFLHMPIFTYFCTAHMSIPVLHKWGTWPVMFFSCWGVSSEGSVVISTRGKCSSARTWDLGAHQHGLGVANTRLFNVPLPGLACVCGEPTEAAAGWARSFPFHPVGQRTGFWWGAAALAPALTAQWREKPPPKTSSPNLLLSPGHLVLQTYKCSSVVRRETC